MSESPKPSSETDLRNMKLPREVPATLTFRGKVKPVPFDLPPSDLEPQLAAARQDVGALWTCISKISGPIKKCFVDRTMPFAEFIDIAVAWQNDNTGADHPDLLREQLAAAREELVRLRKVCVEAREAATRINGLAGEWMLSRGGMVWRGQIKAVADAILELLAGAAEGGG